MQVLAKKHLKFLLADKGYRGHGYGGETTVLIETSANKKKHKHLKRRSSIEPVISHAKAHHRMGRNFLKGHHGDLANTLLAACGYNLKKIYNTFKKAYKKMLSLWFLCSLLRKTGQKEYRYCLNGVYLQCTGPEMDQNPNEIPGSNPEQPGG